MLNGTHALLRATRARDFGPGVVGIAGGVSSGAFSGDSASLRMDSDGRVYSATGVMEAWITPQNGMTLYQVKARIVSGAGSSNYAAASAAFDSWLDFSTDRSWILFAGTLGRTSVIEIQLRRASDGAVLDTANYTLNSWVDPEGAG